MMKVRATWRRAEIEPQLSRVSKFSLNDEGRFRAG